MIETKGEICNLGERERLSQSAWSQKQIHISFKNKKKKTTQTHAKQHENNTLEKTRLHEHTWATASSMGAFLGCGRAARACLAKGSQTMDMRARVRRIFPNPWTVPTAGVDKDEPKKH